MITLSVFPISENMTYIPELLTLASDMTTGVLGFGIWILIVFGSLAVTGGFRSGDGLITSLFLSFFASIILWALGLLTIQFTIFSAILFVAAIIFTKSSRGGMPT